MHFVIDDFGAVVASATTLQGAQKLVPWCLRYLGGAHYLTHSPKSFNQKVSDHEQCTESQNPA